MNHLLRGLVIAIAGYYLVMLGFAVTSWVLRDRPRRLVTTTEGQAPVLHFN